MADHQTIEYIQNTIREVLQRAGVEAQVEYEDSLVDGLVFNIRSRDAKMLIGHQGVTLYALEHIIHAMVARRLSSQRVVEDATQDSSEARPDSRVFFSVDVDEYKRKRQYHIKQMIKEEVAEKTPTATKVNAKENTLEKPNTEQKAEQKNVATSSKSNEDSKADIE